MNGVQIFNYNGASITFNNGDRIMVNATEMAKAFGKRPVDWLQNQQSQDYINALSEVRKSTSADLVRVIKGGAPNAQGTWMHEDVAIEFARWLSPAFAIWCNDRIKELMTKGSTSLHIPKTLSEALRLAADQAEQLEAQKRQLELQAPAVTFTQAVQGSNRSCLVGELAKMICQNGYDIGEKRLFEWLRSNGYLGKSGERRNIPNQQYIEQGLFEIKRGVRSGSNGVMHTTVTPKVTGKGQVYFINKFLQGIEKPALL